MMFVNEQKQHMEKKMAIEVFNRYEKKYRIRDDTYYKLRERLSEYMEADEHSKDGDFYTICNIYYDTPDNYLIRKSIRTKMTSHLQLPVSLTHKDPASLCAECGHEVTYSLRIRVHPPEDFCLIGKYTIYDCTFLLNKKEIL